MEQYTIESFEKLVEILRTHIGLIKGNADNLLSWERGVKYTIDIPLAELDAKYGGEISECMYYMSDNNGVMTDYGLIHFLHPCLADVNAHENEKYANYLRNLVKDGWNPSEDSYYYYWCIGYPCRFDQDSKTLTLTIVGIKRNMYTPEYSTYGKQPENLVLDFYAVLRKHIGQIKVEDCKQEAWDRGVKYSHSGSVKYSLDIPLAEFDAKYGGKISDWLDGMENDRYLMHELKPCLADLNASSNEQYAIYLRNLVKDGTASSEDTLYDWGMVYPNRFDSHTKTLHLTVVGNQKDMYRGY